MDGIHEMAAEIYVQIVAARSSHGGMSPQDAADLARDSYAFARAFFDEHGRHLERDRGARLRLGPRRSRTEGNLPRFPSVTSLPPRNDL